VCKLYSLFISADAAQEKKKEKKVLLPTGVSKSTARTVDKLSIIDFLFLQLKNIMTFTLAKMIKFKV
jgi:hypothetical protein